MDTSAFDDAIAAKETEIVTEQGKVDTDPFIIEQKAALVKAKKLSDAQNTKVDLENKKAQFVSIKEQIEIRTQEIATLTQQAEDLVASITP